MCVIICLLYSTNIVDCFADETRNYDSQSIIICKIFKDPFFISVNKCCYTFLCVLTRCKIATDWMHQDMKREKKHVRYIMYHITTIIVPTHTLYTQSK